MKKSTTKKSLQKKEKWVAVSGGFDPIHVGHVRMFNEARLHGERLVVILNNDNWLIAKKGFVFMPEKERKEIIESFESVDKVVLTSHKKNDSDRSVVHVLKKIRPAVFANGGDRTVHDAHNKTSSLNPEQLFCANCNIQMVFNVGRGGKIQSSSWLVEAARNIEKLKAKKKKK